MQLRNLGDELCPRDRPRRRLAIGILMLALTFPATAGAAVVAGTLVIEVGNVRNDIGRVHADVCAEADFLKESCAYSADADAVSGTTTLTVHGLPPGRYAVQLFHDENRNGKVDRALFGIPKEGVGFSNDAPIRFGPPKFAAAAIAVRPGSQTIAVRMRYFSGPSGPAAKR